MMCRQVWLSGIRPRAMRSKLAALFQTRLQGTQSAPPASSTRKVAHPHQEQSAVQYVQWEGHTGQFMKLASAGDRAVYWFGPGPEFVPPEGELIMVNLTKEEQSELRSRKAWYNSNQSRTRITPRRTWFYGPNYEGFRQCLDLTLEQESAATSQARRQANGRHASRGELAVDG
ncbi:uncharacterized protein C8Q71DRAFT_309564 [Rhodofomes roseus]|uniref:Uncharacterized protein n=1 Tax=Rhodofomes roseus TaxID=34475 RepID=A0ABQ8K329_9APHY|nr:uncharacterized protein C8Q71DRAFT_309564 [Rhodofomes roseus]KAH9831203.1 hypothetical protein C8Q71DRAFT_309564 [Rhodofomes roseus]